MDKETKEIDTITFGIMSADEMRSISSFQVKTVKISSSNLLETVHDPKSGPIGSIPCETCHQNEWECPGHFGHIELNVPIVHPLFLNHVVNLLKIFCWRCNEFLLTRDHLELSNILKLTKDKRFNAILEKIKKCDRCVHCFAQKVDYKLGLNDLTYKTIYRIHSKEDRPKEVMYPVMIKKLFENIKPEYIAMLEIAHPKDFCLTVFPVIPSCCRPHEIQDGNINDDDLTYQLMEIVKNNAMIGTIQVDQKDMEKEFPQCLEVKKNNFTHEAPRNDIIDKYLKLNEKHIKYVNNLKFRIETYCNNSQGKATHATTGRAIKGLRERLTGKEGQIRNNLLGKRCEMSGRTVIGPDPSLKIDEIILPEEMAKSLSVPVIVNKYNIKELTKIVNNGEAIRLVKKNELGNEIKINLAAATVNYGTILRHDDKIKRDGKIIIVRNPKNFKLEADDLLLTNNTEGIVRLPSKKHIDLQEGWVIHRNIKNGDIIFLNRQPTLHKASMMAFKCKISPIKTIKINLACAKPFNADFDGDEMNIHIPQSEESRIELLMLSTPKQCLMSSQAGKPNLTIVQDSLTGAYLMSREKNDEKTLTVAQYNDILLVLTLESDGNCLEYYLRRQQEVRITLKKLGFTGEVRNGRGLLSLLLPSDLFIENSDLKISFGVLHEGFLCKKYLSSTETSLIKVLYKEYGVDICSAFINNIQFLTNRWLMISSFSIHAGDCIKKRRQGNR